MAFVFFTQPLQFFCELVLYKGRRYRLLSENRLPYLRQTSTETIIFLPNGFSSLQDITAMMSLEALENLIDSELTQVSQLLHTQFLNTAPAVVQRFFYEKNKQKVSRMLNVFCIQIGKLLVIPEKSVYSILLSVNLFYLSLQLRESQLRSYLDTYPESSFETHYFQLRHASEQALVGDYMLSQDRKSVV